MIGALVRFSGDCFISKKQLSDKMGSAAGNPEGEAGG